MPAFLPLLFDSERLPARDRLAICREEFGRNLLRAELEFPADRPLRFSLRGRHIGAVNICATSGTPLSSARDRTLAADGNGTCAVIVPVRGRFLGGHGSDLRPLAPGQVMALHCARSGALLTPTGGSFLSIMIPGEMMGDVLDGTPMRYGEAHTPSPAELRLVLSYLRVAGQDGPQLSPRTAFAVGRHLAELLALAFGSRAEPASQAIRLAQRQAIAEEIGRHFTDPGLSLPILAARLGLSERRVQELLDEAGTSYTEEVRRRRLDRARALLGDPGNRDVKVIDIALDCGFSDVSHFNRLFKARFGDTPSGVKDSVPQRGVASLRSLLSPGWTGSVRLALPTG